MFKCQNAVKSIIFMNHSIDFDSFVIVPKSILIKIWKSYQWFTIEFCICLKTKSIILNKIMQKVLISRIVDFKIQWFIIVFKLKINNI